MITDNQTLSTIFLKGSKIPGMPLAILLPYATFLLDDEVHNIQNQVINKKKSNSEQEEL